jgi:stage V sporulation protein AE
MSCSKCGERMIYVYAFLFAGLVCLIGQLILDLTNLKAGDVTSLFVVIGAFLDIFGIYDFFVHKFGAGAMVVIPSFGHLLIHGALLEAKESGLLGLFTGMFSLTATGITATIIFSFIIAIVFKPKN